MSQVPLRLDRLYTPTSKGLRPLAWMHLLTGQQGQRPRPRGPQPPHPPPTTHNHLRTYFYRYARSHSTHATLNPAARSLPPQAGADPWKVIRQMREKLRLNAAPVQIPIGTEDALRGLVCLVDRKAYNFEGSSGERVVGEWEGHDCASP